MSLRCDIRHYPVDGWHLQLQSNQHNAIPTLKVWTYSLTQCASSTTNRDRSPLECSLWSARVMEELCISVAMTEERRTTQMYRCAHPQGGVGEKWACDGGSAEKKRRGNMRWRLLSVLQEERIWNVERVAVHPKGTEVCSSPNIRFGTGSVRKGRLA